MSNDADTSGIRDQPETRFNDRLVAACLLGISLFELIELHAHVRLAGIAAATLLVVFVCVGHARLGLRERYLVTLAVAATIAAVTFSDAPLALIERGFTQATYLAAFMLLLALLRDGAVTSQATRTVGS